MTLSRKYVLPVFFLVIFAGAVILGPLLYFALGAVFPIPFHRAMDRALLICAVAAMGLFWSRLSFAKLWPWERGAGRQLLYGYLMAFVTIQAMIGLQLVFCGWTSAHLTGSQIGSRLLIALAAALLIPPLEETVFRGFLQTELVAGLGRLAGWLLAAFIFMLAHFLKVPVELDHLPVHFTSGGAALGAAFLPLLHGDFLCGRGLNLFLVGLILGGVFIRSGSLWLNTGLHSGWIFSLLLFTGLTRPTEPAPVTFLAGDILSSFLTTVVLMVFGIWLWLFYRPPWNVPETGVNAP